MVVYIASPICIAGPGCSPQAGKGEGLARPGVAVRRVYPQQADADRIGHRGGRAARAVVCHLPEVHHPAHQFTRGQQRHQHAGARLLGEAGNVRQHLVTLRYVIAGKCATDAHLPDCEDYH